MKLRQVAMLLVLFGIALHGQQSVVKVPTEPANLGTIKQQLIEYQSCAQPAC